MPLTVSGVLPVLLIVRVAVAVELTATVPKARLPLTPMILVTATRLPEMIAVLVPLVMSEATVTVPLYVWRAVGLNVTVTSWLPPARIVPPLQSPLNPLG